MFSTITYDGRLWQPRSQATSTETWQEGPESVNLNEAPSGGSY